MSAIIRLSPHAFVVWWKDVERWDPSSFHRISWHWPDELMKPLGSVLTPRKEKIDRTKVSFAELQPITIHFDGTIDRRKVEASAVSSSQVSRFLKAHAAFAWRRLWGFQDCIDSTPSRLRQLR